MSDTVRIKLYVETGFANCKHEDIYEHDRSDWEGMSQEQQDALLDELAVDYRNERCACSAWVLEDGET